jgi:hypothetical protein
MYNMNNKDHISTKLEGLKKELPFRVPAHYFDDFPARMQHRLEMEKQSETKPKTRVIDLIKPALSLAAGFAAVFILVYLPVKTINNRQTAENNTSRSEQVTSIDFINLFESIDEQTFYALLENEPVGDALGAESLIAYLTDSFSDYDVFMETQK